MQRIGTSDGLYHSGDQSNTVLGTAVTADVMNANQEELAAIVEAAGFTLDASGASPANNAQVLQAIRRLMGSPVVLADVGAVNAYSAVNIPAYTADTWKDDVLQRLTIKVTNTGPSTLQVDGLPVVPIYGLGLKPLAGGELTAGNTAVFARKTIAGINGGAAIAILMSCPGGAIQVPPALSALHAVNLGQAQALNLGGLGGSPKMSATVAAGATSVTFSDDYVNVSSSTTSAGHRVDGVTNMTLNLGTVGIGGIDVGTAQANAFLAVYRALNPTTQAVGVFAKSVAVGAIVSAVYNGANAPAGYTETSLIALVPISATAGQFGAFTLEGRHVTITETSLLNVTGSSATYMAVPLGSVIPASALTIDGNLTALSTSTSTSSNYLAVAVDATGLGARSVANGTTTIQGTYYGLRVKTIGTIYYRGGASVGTAQSQITATGYTF